jgi:hypothetical protein
VALDTGELAGRHRRSFARPARSPRSSTPASCELRGAPPEPEIEQRPLQVYDALIPA